MAGHVDVGVAEYLGDDVDRHPVFDRKRGERMSCAVRRQVLRYVAQRRNFFQIGIHLRVRRHGKQLASRPARFIPLVFPQQRDRMR